MHQVALPSGFGHAGLFPGESASLLTPHVGDAASGCPEVKAFLCKVSKV